MKILAKQVYIKSCVKAIYTKKAMNSSKKYNFFTELIVVENSAAKKKFLKKICAFLLLFLGVWVH